MPQKGATKPASPNRVVRIAIVKDREACAADWSQEYDTTIGKTWGMSPCDVCSQVVGFPHVHAWLNVGFGVYCMDCKGKVKKGKDAP